MKYKFPKFFLFLEVLFHVGIMKPHVWFHYSNKKKLLLEIKNFGKNVEYRKNVKFKTSREGNISIHQRYVPYWE